MTTEIERGGMDVSGSHEPSYYEIALTNRQVVVAFVILLTCVVAAFFSGVWIGRESTARAQERLALLARGHGGDPADGALGAGGAAGGDKEKPDGQALQEFKFFADPRHRPAAAAKGAHDANDAANDASGQGGGGSTGGAAGATGADAARDAGGSRGKPAGAAATQEPAPARPDSVAGKGAPAQAAPAGRSTLAEDLGRRAGSPAGSAAASVPAAPKAAASAVRNERGGDRKHDRSPAANAADAAPAGEGEPLPAAPEPATRTSRTAGSEPASATGGKKPAITWSPAAASPAAAAAAAPAGSTEIGTPGEVVIQVFSTADKEQADKVRDGLVDAGFTAFLSPLAKGGQTMYRVRIGPFPSRSAAEAVAEKVRRERKLDTWITPK